MASFKQKIMSACNKSKKNYICSCPSNSLSYCLKVNNSKFSGFIPFPKTCENSTLITDRQQNHMQKHTLTTAHPQELITVCCQECFQFHRLLREM